MKVKETPANQPFDQVYLQGIASDWTRRLLDWYAINKRPLPWRDVGNPYFTWLSEIILQQTRIDQGMAYYHRFVTQYPDVESLANATEQEVLRLWQGLGYYSRARSLHVTAKQVAAQYGKQFPTHYHDLIKLKGIGPYTAAAIASIAGHEDHVALDGNLFRVLARAFDIALDIAVPATRVVFNSVGQALLPKGQAGDFNQALMDLGATICTPKQPTCNLCPIETYCIAKRNGTIANRPVKNSKIKNKVRYLHFLVFTGPDNSLWLRKREGKGIWEGLWEFPTLETAAELPWQDLVNSADHFDPELGSLHKKLANQLPKRIWYSPKHQLTHQTLVINFYLLNATPLEDVLENAGFIPLDQSQLADVPKPVPIVNFLKEVDWRN